MLHIAEGRLHAYVDRDRSDLTDGEAAIIESHLGSCEQCSAVVREATLVRDRANMILARSGPQRVVTPDFAAIQARAGMAERRSDPAAPPELRQRPRMQRSYVALAWTASLIAALGLGWITRDLFRERDQVAVQMATSDAERGDRITFGTSADTQAAPGDASGVAALPPNAGTSPVARRSAAGAVPREPIGAASVAKQSPRDVAAPASAQSDRPDASVLPSTAAGGLSSGDPASSAASRATFDTTVESDAGGVTSNGDLATRDAPPAAPRAASRTSVAAAPSPPASSAPNAPEQGAIARLAWVEMSREEAERRFGAPLMTIPNLPVRRVAMLGSGPSAMTRVWQSAPGGEEVILSQARQSADQIAGTAAQLVRRVGEMVVMAEGDLPPEKLRELLDSVR